MNPGPSRRCFDSTRRRRTHGEVRGGCNLSGGNLDIEQADGTWRERARHRARGHHAATVGRFPRARSAPLAAESGARGASACALLTRNFRCASGSTPHLCGWPTCPEMRPGFSSRNTRSNGVEPDSSPPRRRRARAEDKRAPRLRHPSRRRYPPITTSIVVVGWAQVVATTRMAWLTGAHGRG